MSSFSSLSRRRALRVGGAVLALAGYSGRTTGQDSSVSVQETGDIVQLSNERVSAHFDAQTGGIVQISDQDGLGLRDPDAAGPDAVWGLQFYSDEYDNVLATSWSAPDPKITTNIKEGKASVTLRFNGAQIKAPGNPEYQRQFDGTVTVTATVKAGNPLVFWDIEVKNRTSMAIRAVRCPYLTNIGSLDDPSTDRLILPQRSGRAITDPIPLHSSIDVRYPSGFGTMQFSAYIGDSGGFYIDARDTDGYTKRITWGDQWTDSNHLFARHEYNVPKEAGADVSVPYRVTVGPMGSNWYEAADRYRTWLDSTDLLPDSGKSWPDWYLNRGATFSATSYVRSGHDNYEEEVSFETTADRTISIQNTLDMPLQFSWWGYQKHGNFGAGDWFPPKEGWDAFDRAISRLNEHDVVPLGYALTNVLLEASDLYQNTTEQAKTWLVRTQDGGARTGKLHGMNHFQPELAQDGWQQELFNVFESHVSHGAKQVQLDGFPWTGTPECYADPHDHPDGLGGNWYAKASKTFISKLEQRLHNIDESVLLSGEGFADFYLPQLDIATSRDVRAEAEDPRFQSMDTEVIPLTQYTLGEYISFRGSNRFPLVTADWTEPASYLRLVTGRSLEWGMLPLFRVAIDVDENLQSETLLSYLRRVGRTFQLHGTRFLVEGEMRPKPDLDVPEIRTSTSGPDGESVSVNAKSILHSVWESTALGEREYAGVFTNISAESQEVEIREDHLNGMNELVYTVLNGEYERRSVADSQRTLTVELPPRTVLLIVETPSSKAKREALGAISKAQTEELGDMDAAIKAFNSGDYRVVREEIKAAQQAASTGSPTPSESRRESPTPSSEGTQEVEVSPTTHTTTGSGPGFSVLGALGSLAAGVGYLLLKRAGSDSTDDGHEE